MRGGEADAHFGGGVGNHREEPREVDDLARRGLVAVAVDVLPQKRSLAEAFGAEVGKLGKDALGRTRAFASAGIGDDAVGAEVVASAHDADKT